MDTRTILNLLLAHPEMEATIKKHVAALRQKLEDLEAQKVAINAATEKQIDEIAQKNAHIQSRQREIKERIAKIEEERLTLGAQASTLIPTDSTSTAQKGKKAIHDLAAQQARIQDEIRALSQAPQEELLIQS